MKDGRPGRELTHSDGSDRAPTSGGLFRPQPKIPREASWVTVRVWLPRDGAGNIVTARKAISDGNVGHASLQTAEIYASWWPTEPIVSAKRVLDKVKGCLVPSLDNDKEYEGRDSDVEITFRSLDTVAINTAFHEFKTKDRDWGLLGSFFTSDYSDKLDYTNCSGLVFYLLCQGGIQKKPYFKEFKEKRFHITSAAVFGATYTAVSTPLMVSSQTGTGLGAAGLALFGPLGILLATVYGIVAATAVAPPRAAEEVYYLAIAPEDIAELVTLGEKCEKEAMTLAGSEASASGGIAAGGAGKAASADEGARPGF